MRVGWDPACRDRAPDLRRLSARRLRVSRYAERRFQSTRPGSCLRERHGQARATACRGELAGLPAIPAAMAQRDDRLPRWIVPERVRVSDRHSAGT